MKCRRCRQEKSEIEFGRDCTRLTGYHPWCRACKNISEKLRKKAKPKPTAKTCSRCGVKKPIKQFRYKRHRKQTAQAAVKQRHQWCSQCVTQSRDDIKLRKHEYQKAYIARNRELIRQKQKCYYSARTNKFKWQRDQLKAKAIAALGGKCALCGIEPSEQTPLYCFDFHHLDMVNKRNEIGSLLSSASRLVNSEVRMAEFYEELKSCELLCAICHRKRHYEREEDVEHAVLQATAPA